ncbi:MAG: 3-dehydroquinate synthase, partial [Fusobacteriaceae bacterium]
MEILKMKTFQRDYNIYIGEDDIFDNLSNYLKKYDSILILSNSTVAPLYINNILNSFSKDITEKNIHSFQIDDGEEFKNFETANKIFDFMLKNSFFRNSIILTLGGGVVCDMGGFVASTFMRGIDFIQIPTSLLAQVDASIGGKVAINHENYKNSIGAFYQPQAVFINIIFLKSLPKDQFSSGMGEIIKHSLISKDNFLREFLLNNSETILSLDYKKLIQTILLSCSIKKNIVEKDEFERGERAFLNLGHTYGHALEATYNFQNITHGEAVAKGAIFELLLARELGVLTDFTILKRARDLFSLFGLSSEPIKIENNILLNHMLKDKKNSLSGINFVILKSEGDLSAQKVDKNSILQVNNNLKKNFIKAVIDIGTNSTRLLVAEVEQLYSDGGTKIKKDLLELVEITQLGKGVDKNRLLSEDSISITI